MDRRLVAMLSVLYLTLLAANRAQMVVRGPSMEPTLWPGDRLVTLVLPPWMIARVLRVGDVVVVADPVDPTHLVVKRVHGMHDGRIDVRGDAPDRSTDSRSWGPLPSTSVRRLVVRRWPDVRTPMRRVPVEPARGSDGEDPRADQPGTRATTSSSGSSSPTSPGPRTP